MSLVGISPLSCSSSPRSYMGRDSLLLKPVAGNAVTVFSSTVGGLTQLLKRCWGLEVLKPGHHVLFSECQQWTLLSLCISFASSPANWSTPANQSTSMYLPVFTSLLSLNLQRCHFLLHCLTWKAVSLRCGQAAALHKGWVGVEGTSVTIGHSCLLGKYLLFGAELLIPQSSCQEPRAHCPLHLWRLMRKTYLHMSNMLHLFVIPGSKLYQYRLLGEIRLENGNQYHKGFHTFRLFSATVLWAGI